MAWKVIEVPGTVKTFKFQNRATGDFLSIMAKEYSNKVDASDKAITTWALGDNGLQAEVGDSLYYLNVHKTTGVFYLSRSGSADSHTDMVKIYPREMKNEIILNANDFNNEIKGFSFADVTGRKAPKDKTAGDNILTKYQWVATQTGAGLADTQGKPYLMFQKKGAKAEEDFLKVDTTYVGSTYAYKLTLDSCKTAANGTSVRGFMKYKDAEASEAAEEDVFHYTINDSLALFRVSYHYAKDSMNIYPVALPSMQSANLWDGVGDAAGKTDTVSVMFYSAKWGIKDAGDSARVALKSIENSTYLVIDSCGHVVLNSGDKTVYTNTSHPDHNQVFGVTEARIVSTGRSTVVGGDAEIAAGVYFMKNMNKKASDGTDNADYNKYKVFALTGEATTASKGDVAVPSTQWVVVAGSAKGIYTIMNREYQGQKMSGTFNTVKGEDGKAIANTFVCQNDTIYLEDAKCASVEDLITVDGHKRATTGYGYFDAKTLANKKIKVASASPYMSALFMQPRKDSTLVLDEAEYSFYLKLPARDGKEKVGGVIGAQAAGVDTLYRQSYILVTSRGEWVSSPASENGAYTLTKTAGKDTAVFYLKSWGAADNYALVDTINSVKNGGLAKVAINAQTATVTKVAADATLTDLFTVAELDAPSVLFTDPAHFNIYNNNDRLAVGKNNLAVMAQPGNDLKADADKFVNDNFTLWFDTVNYVKDQTASYFISQGIKAAAEEEEVKAETAVGERLYLTVASADSIDKSDDLAKLYTLDGKNRLYFRTASRYDVDSLIVSNFDEKAGVMAPDTVCAGGDGKINKATGTVRLPGIENFKFIFESIDGTKNYHMKTANNDYVVSINGLLVAISENSIEDNAKMVATLNAPDYATSNEGVAVSEVKVIAANGGVQVVGAAGKKVVITNILGQTVANTIITSDNATIAAPAGVVVVAVEGEEAVKAIVK
ncbi:DUF6383 domain-containing protein [uncultured Parabacteroides sp.]|uniref:DUF6383 domain-containing protein n=1 Tax=uncultured Parabacteroides sp. TaxID=512312 RepID=UPI0025FE7AB2|nr:DUF6383 domain-containing protein [uncultured Parabacteroides sp.]